MSRMTPAQIIAIGEYLETDFDPSKLTVSQLLGVLSYHNIVYPTPYSKTKLVQLFNEELKPRSAKYKKERTKRASSVASDDGITDGLTGQPLNATRKPPPRRSSRRLSHTPSEQEVPTTPTAKPVSKRQRPSAQPQYMGPSRVIVPVHSPVVEVSEPEESPKKPRRGTRESRMGSEVPTSGGDASNVLSAAEDSGWEDNNIFQSGAEDSSPVRAPVKPKIPRKSTGSRKSRKSIQQLAPPSPTSPQLFGQHNFPTPQLPSFEPDLSPLVRRETRRINQPPPTLQNEEEEEETQKPRAPSVQAASISTKEADQEPREVNEQETLPIESLRHPADIAIDELEAALKEEDETSNHVDHVPEVGGTQKWPAWLRMITFFVALATTSTFFTYKQESASIGFCERGTDSNPTLRDMRTHRVLVDDCNRHNRTLLFPPGSAEGLDAKRPCPLPNLLLPQPDSCTPCPDHATCHQFSVSCDNGYLLRSHPLMPFLPPPSYPLNGLISSSSPSQLVWKAISTTMDGIPGFGSVAFPPRCEEDPKRKRHIGVLGKAIEAMLGQERGRRVCAGGKFLDQTIEDKYGGEAKKWGVEVENLRDVMRKKTTPHLLPTFDDTFNEALQQLIQWGGVIIGEDLDGKRYLAHRTPDLTWNCALTVKARQIWVKWRATVLGISAFVLVIYLIRARRTQKRVEDKRVAELVQIALDALRNQELAHHTDPITTPYPYLSSLQLRDLILQEVHSVTKRQRIWSAVERIVESNSNVRTNLEETPGGDELRVWRWVGSARKPIFRRGRVPTDKEAREQSD